MDLVPFSKVDSLVVPPVKFYLEHYIPTQGIVLLYGRFGSYKTPLTLNMAKALSQGGELWGLPIEKAEPVLYVQCDMPKAPALKRIQELGFGTLPGDFAFAYPGFDVVNPNSSMESGAVYSQLQAAHKVNQYKVVFIDSLRCIHNLNDHHSETVNRVYQGLARLFPDAVIVLVHHDRKVNPEGLSLEADDKEALMTESFSGSQGWMNHAVVGIKVHKKSRKEITLIHTKSQAGEQQPNLGILVEAGIHMDSKPCNVADVAKFLVHVAPGVTQSEKDRLISEHFRVSERTARRRRVECEGPITDPKI